MIFMVDQKSRCADSFVTQVVETAAAFTVVVLCLILVAMI